MNGCWAVTISLACQINRHASVSIHTAEYGVSKASISKWCAEFSEECQTKAILNPESPNEAELMKENLRLRKELEESRKENLFLKKAAAFFAKEID